MCKYIVAFSLISFCLTKKKQKLKKVRSPTPRLKRLREPSGLPAAFWLIIPHKRYLSMVVKIRLYFEIKLPIKKINRWNSV